MPMNFAIGKEDMLRQKLLTPGVYVLKVKNITQAPGKNDPQSTTTEVNFEVVDGPDAAKNGFIGVPIKHWFSEKLPEMALGFIEAVTGKKIGNDGVNVDLEQAIGRDVKAFVKNEKYMNRMTNRIEGFMGV